MQLEWIEGSQVRNSHAYFRVNALSRSIADTLRIAEDEIWWLLLIEPEEGLSIERVLELATELDIGEPETFLRVPDEYSEDDLRAVNFGLSTLYARRNYVDAINDPDNENTGIAFFQVGPAFRPDEVTPEGNPFLPDPEDRIDVPDDSVVVAVIDNGMAVGHDLFRGPPKHPGGAPTTRIYYFWNMDGSGEGDVHTTIGNEWTKSGLDAALAANVHNGLLDDPAFYAEIGAIDWSRRRHTPIAHRLSHGTHVMALCAGYDQDEAVCDQDEAVCDQHEAVGASRPIIAVNLRSFDVQDPSGNLFESYLEQALNYIIKRYLNFRLKDSGGRPPLVINFSFGNYAGPHDGNGLVERKIAKALGSLGQNGIDAQFILPGGNGNESRCHARFEVDPDAGASPIDWRVQPGDRSASVIEFWFDPPKNFDKNYLKLTVQAPGGIGPVTIDTRVPPQVWHLQDASGNVAATLSFTPPAAHQPLGVFTLLLVATSSPTDTGPFAPSGLWRCTFETCAKKPVGVTSWVQRDEDLPGFPEFGRQSYLDMESYTRFYHPGVDANHLDRRLIGGPLGYDPIAPTSPVKRSGTLSGFTTGKDTIVIGGFVRSTDRMALYSASGPTNTSQRHGPDASARSDDSEVLRGVLSAGSASGSRVAMPGTSVSAPQVARWVAGEMSGGNQAGRPQVRQKAQQTDPNAGTKPPNDKSGGGRMAELEVLFNDRRWRKPDP